MNDRCLNFLAAYASLKQWHGYRLLGVDGTTLRLPNTMDIPEDPPPMSEAQGHSKGPPLARTSLLYDPLNKLSLSLQLDRIQVGETEPLRSHDWSYQLEQLLLCSGHYGVFWIFSWLGQKQGRFGIRLIPTQRKITRDFIQEGIPEKTVEFRPNRRAKKQWRQLGISYQPIPLRLIRVELSPREGEVRGTHVLEFQSIPAQDFHDLYFLRWPVEEKFKQRKYRLNLDNGSGKSAWTIDQDAYARLWSSNPTVMLAHEQEPEIAVRTSTCQYPYPIIGAGTFSTMKRSMVRISICANPREIIERLRYLFRDRPSHIQINRIFPSYHKPYKNEFCMCYKFYSC